MSCAYAPSAPAELPSFNALSKTTKTQTNKTQSISFSSQLVKSTISIRNPYGPPMNRPKAQIQAFYMPAQTTQETLYDLLGVTENDSLVDIKKAYKQMARKYHPDVSPLDQVDENTKRFIMVQQAYETLSDPQIRASYDRELAKGSDFAFSSRAKPYHYNQRMDETGEWRMRWNSQIDDLLRKSSMNSCNGTRGKVTWGARMRNQR